MTTAAPHQAPGQASGRPPAPPEVPTPAERPIRIATPARLAGAIAQLALMGVIGPGIFTALITLFGVGLGLVPIAGVGLILLVLFVYGVFALGWLEAARIDGLYGFGLPARRVRVSDKTGFAKLMHTLWLQAIDPNAWRGVANAAIATIIGGIVLVLAMAFATGLALVFSPLYTSEDVLPIADIAFTIPSVWAVPSGVLVAVLALAAIVGLAALHGVLARAIMVPSREAQLAEQARTSSAQREGAVRAADVERTRIERDLHDGVQPRLVSVGMTLGLAQQKIDDDPAAAKALLDEAHTSTKAAITELRQLARGIHASVLDDRGLDAALSALAARSHVPVQLDVRVDGRCSRDAEAAAYFAIAESLTNAAKHSRARAVRVVVRLRDGNTLWARVEDDGVGGARIVPGGGLDGISNRILAAGGTSRLDSPAGGPTSLEVSVPCAS